MVATLALNPHHHKSLLDVNVPDALTQLILPSDEWYYTNHSTRNARFVKHHAARILVYLGLQHRVNHRVNVYDLLLGKRLYTRKFNFLSNNIGFSIFPQRRSSTANTARRQFRRCLHHDDVGPSSPRHHS